MLYGQDAIEYAKRFEFARLERYSYDEDENGREIEGTGEWGRVYPEYFTSYPNYPIDKNVRVNDEAKYFINSYVHGMVYGGPEEGGWWRHYFNPVATLVCTDPDQVEEIREREKEVMSDEHAWGDIKSVLDGEEVVVWIEDHFPEAQIDSPYYE